MDLRERFLSDVIARRSRRLRRCFNVTDLRALARRKLPAPIFHYLDGGADDELSLHRNVTAFDDYSLLPRHLRDVSTIDTSTTVLGRRIAMPLVCAPTGMSRLFHHQAEPAVARAARSAGVFYSLSTMATASIETVARVSDGPKLFQIYLFRDRGLTADFVDRCKAAKYDALCLTIDTPCVGNRERDHMTGMLMPPRLTLRNLLRFAGHPSWTLAYLLGPRFEIENIAQNGAALGKSTQSPIDYANRRLDPKVSWREAERLRSAWPGPFVIKGVQSMADARRAVEIGATALMISNHGGRQLDGTMAPVDLVAHIRDAVGRSAELIVDGGVRRGTHILKALALGADACSIGRGYLYGLAAAGEAGVAHALALLRAELERDMALLGARRIEEVTREFIHVSDYSDRSRRRLVSYRKSPH
jgi:L-lactate dehydrogenase (cytochrome)